MPRRAAIHHQTAVEFVMHKRNAVLASGPMFRDGLGIDGLADTVRGCHDREHPRFQRVDDGVP